MHHEWEMNLADQKITVVLLMEFRKTIRLHFRPPYLVEVKAPLKTPPLEIKKILVKKQKWLLTKMKAYGLNEDLAQPRLYQEGETFLHQGEKLELRIHLQENWRHYQAFREGKVLAVWGPQDDPLHIATALRSWYEKEAKEKIGQRLQELAEEKGFHYEGFSLGNGKTLWGTCKQNGAIRINWRGICLAPQVLDYLLIHELCHLKEMNHSKKFWDEVQRHQTDWKERRKQLKEMGFLLSLFRS